MLIKQGHYLHFFPDNLIDSHFNLYYSKPSNEQAFEIKLPENIQGEQKTPYGWVKCFMNTQFDEIVFTLGLEQEWDEAPWKSYPIIDIHLATTGFKNISKSVVEASNSISILQNNLGKLYSQNPSYVESYDHHYSSSPQHYIEEELEQNKKLKMQANTPVFPNSEEYSIFTKEDEKYGFVLYYDHSSMVYTLRAKYAGKSYVGNVSLYLSKSKTLSQLFLCKESMIGKIKQDFAAA